MCNQGSQNTQPLFSIDLHLRRNCPFGSRYSCIFGFYPSSTDLLVILSLHQAKIQKDRYVAEQCLLRILFSHCNGSFRATNQTISIWMLALPWCQALSPLYMLSYTLLHLRSKKASLHAAILWRSRWWRALGDEIDIQVVSDGWNTFFSQRVICLDCLFKLFLKVVFCCGSHRVHQLPMHAKGTEMQGLVVNALVHHIERSGHPSRSCPLDK